MHNIGRGRIVRAGGLVACLFAVWLLVAAVPALAHSRLERAEPPAGAVLTAPPTIVHLHFDQNVNLQFSQVQVLDRAHHEVSAGALTQPGSDGAALAIGLQSDLHSGAYTVIWRVVSAVDGHVTQGNFAWTLQLSGTAVPGTPEPTEPPAVTGSTGAAPDNGGGGAAAGDTSSPPPPPLRWLWRALALFSAAGLLGAPLFSSLVLSGALPAEAGALARPLGRRLVTLMTVLAALLLVSLFADLVYQVGALTGKDAFAALGDMGLARDVILSPGYGSFWLWRLVMGMALLGYGAWRWRSPARTDWTPGVLNGGLLLAGEALGSHGAETRGLAGLPIGMVSDMLHLVATAAWVGGLIYLAAVLLPVLRRGDPALAERLLGRVVPRFSNLALISVAVLVVTGLINLALHTLDPQAIISSESGQVLIVKHLLFLPLLALGALNHQVFRPRLAALLVPGAAPPTGALLHRFGRSVGAEVILVAAILVCAAGLTLLPPPFTAQAALPAPTPTGTPVAAAVTATPAGPPPATATPVVATLSQTVGGVRFDLEVRPDPVSDLLTLDLTRVDTHTVPLSDVLKLQLKVIPQDVDAGSTLLPATRVGPADPNHQVYTATGQLFTLSGTYQVDAEFLRKIGTDLRAGFRLVLADDGSLTMAPSDVLQAQITTHPSPPITGTATLDIKVLDGQGRPVTGGTVKITPLMPAHGHVEPQGVAVPVAGQPGVYRTTAHLTMGGAWLVIVEVDRPGQPPVKIDGSFDVIDPNATPTPPPPP